MSRIETSVEIGRAPDEVFAYLADLRNAMEWSSGLVDVQYDGELAQGTSGVDTRRLGGREIRMPWTVTAFEPPDRVVVEYGRPFPATAAFSFRATADGTVVTCATDLRPRGFWRLLAPLMAREARKTDEAQFAKVKRILEGSAQREPASRRASS